MSTSESDRPTMNRHSFDLIYTKTTHLPLCSLTCQASPSVQSEIPSRARSLMRNCPGTADRAGKPPRLGSQTPGVVTRKLRVVRNIPRSEEHTLNSSHRCISYAVFCLKKKKNIV